MQDQEHYLLIFLELLKGTGIDWKSLVASNAVHMCGVANEKVVTNGLPRAKYTTQISLQCVCQGTLLGPHHTQRATTPHGRTARQVSKVKCRFMDGRNSHPEANPMDGLAQVRAWKITTTSIRSWLRRCKTFFLTRATLEPNINVTQGLTVTSARNSGGVLTLFGAVCVS